jgi:hypothetical protein
MGQRGNPLIDFTKWLFKWLAIVIAGLFALGLFLFIGTWAWNWWSHGRHMEKIVVVAINSGESATANTAMSSKTTGFFDDLIPTQAPAKKSLDQQSAIEPPKGGATGWKRPDARRSASEVRSTCHNSALARSRAARHSAG